MDGNERSNNRYTTEITHSKSSTDTASIPARKEGDVSDSSYLDITLLWHGDRNAEATGKGDSVRCAGCGGHGMVSRPPRVAHTPSSRESSVWLNSPSEGLPCNTPEP